MPRNISFALTTDQIRNRTKTVTRRLGWKNLRQGQILNACVKCMGLKPGEQIQRLGQIRVVSATQEPLVAMMRDEAYGKQFVEMFCEHMRPVNGCVTDVTRIEFEYIDIASDCPEFKFIEFNPRRKSRGAEAARVEADGDWMWMSKYEIECNIRDFGSHPELLKALESYK